MKTLKQRMETELNSGLYLCNDFNEIEKEFLRLTKEWLTEFHNTRRYHSYEQGFVEENLFKDLQASLCVDPMQKQENKK